MKPTTCYPDYGRFCTGLCDSAETLLFVVVKLLDIELEVASVYLKLNQEILKHQPTAMEIQPIPVSAQIAKQLCIQLGNFQTSVKQRKQRSWLLNSLKLF